YLLKTIPGIGRILALTILYEIGDIQRFESVQKFASYAFSEAAVLYLRGNSGAQQLLQRFQKRMSKAKALSALA
uniref:transposase n=1 Tax=Aliidiomarina celeris TaxID=2249428 RepID=UPI00130037E4